MDQDNKNNKEDIDLSGALKDSDNNVKFQNEERPPDQSQIFLPGTPKIIQWAIKYSGGLIKDERQARYVILGFVALVIAIALFLVFNSGTREVGKNINPETGEEVIPGQIPGGI